MIKTINKKKLTIENLKILTDKGFKDISKIKVGDTVYDYKGNKTKIKSKSKYNSDTYVVAFNNGIGINIGAKQVIENTRKEVISSARLRDKKGNILRDKNGKLTNKRTFNHKEITRKIFTKDLYHTVNNYRTYTLNHFPYKTALCCFKGNNNKLPLDPYLLGLLLGDGDIAGIKKDRSKGQPKYTVHCKKDPDLLSSITKLVRKYNDNVVRISKSDYDFRINGMHIREILKSLKLWGHTCYTKFIPIDYLMSNKENRLAILQGLMDTDGSCSIKSNAKNQVVCEFDNTSKQLVEQLGLLVYSLGGSTDKLYKKKCNYRKKGKLIELNHYCYRYSIRLPKELSAFRCKRKKAIEKSTKLKSYNSKYFGLSIKGIKKAKKSAFYQITLENGAKAFIGNYYIKMNCRSL